MSIVLLEASASAIVGPSYEVAETTQTNVAEERIVYPDELSDFGAQARASIMKGLSEPGNKYRGSFAQFAG